MRNNMQGGYRAARFFIWQELMSALPKLHAGFAGKNSEEAEERLSYEKAGAFYFMELKYKNSGDVSDSISLLISILARHPCPCKTGAPSEG